MKFYIYKGLKVKLLIDTLKKLILVKLKDKVNMLIANEKINVYNEIVKKEGILIYLEKLYKIFKMRYKLIIR